ncbi:50S ribosomal protein L10 [Marinoscillum sp. 108]|jgi:large subunit ribosomal protein L10|uniref:Large ribosomal subunit protein uL10 n=1 Tax=Marinoscillum luteum TaxID=861051 RepID=A0ABW7N956_9BACT|nr:50S ribosomal protein L10 [Marinoscillum sp. 108]VXD17136.1 50S ribosomal protein L10 [Marinoscillum sp. 108]
MTREEKAQVIAGLTEKFQQTDHFYITDTSGLTVEQINKFREMCFKKGVEYKVVKNTLIKKALENLDNDYSSLDSTLKGFSGIMFVNENANIPARVIKDFKKEDKDQRPKFKAASIDSDIFIGEDQLEILSKLKSKQELIGEVISLLQSPAKNVISALQSGQHTIAGLVKTLSERE